MKNVFLMSLLLLLSCNRSNDEFIIENDENQLLLSDNKKFDYSIFESRNGIYSVLNNLDKEKSKNTINSLSLINNADEVDIFKDKISHINSVYGTNLEYSEVDNFMLNNNNISLEELVSKGFISKEDKKFIDKFYYNISITNDFNQAIKLLEEEILEKEKLSSIEFEKYNFLINMLMVVNDYYSEKGIIAFEGSGYKTKSFVNGEQIVVLSKQSVGCALAIVGNSVATFGLSSCFVPGPNCAIAAIGKAIALASILTSC